MRRISGGMGIFLALLSTILTVGVAVSALGSSNETARDRLQCPNDDLILEAVVESDVDPVGGSQTSRESVDQFFTTQYGRFPTKAFEKVSERSDRAVFHLNENARLRVAVVSELEGDSWAVAGFVSCNSYIERVTSGGGRP